MKRIIIPICVIISTQLYSQDNSTLDSLVKLQKELELELGTWGSIDSINKLRVTIYPNSRIFDNIEFNKIKRLKDNGLWPSSEDSLKFEKFKYDLKNGNEEIYKEVYNEILIHKSYLSAEMYLNLLLLSKGNKQNLVFLFENLDLTKIDNTAEKGFGIIQKPVQKLLLQNQELSISFLNYILESNILNNCDLSNPDQMNSIDFIRYLVYSNKLENKFSKFIKKSKKKSLKCKRRIVQKILK